MTHFGEVGDERLDSKREETEQEPSSRPPYDPISNLWEEPPAEATFAEGEPTFDPLFESEWVEAERVGAHEPSAWEEPPGLTPRLERHLGSWHPLGYERPEEPTDQQRQAREGAATTAKPRRRWAITAREVVETLLLALLIFLAVRASFQNFRVEGASMSPSLQNGEYLIVNKLAYAQIDLSIFDWLPFYDAGDNSVHHLWAAPSRGDVIVFLSPRDAAHGRDRDFVKRIIGVPGDTIEIRPDRNQVLVNGQVIEEPYAFGKTTCGQNCGPWQVPPANTAQSIAACGSSACYFVMGDNRQNSSDSRQGWLVPEENIIGKALITYWKDGGPELGLAPNRSIGFSGEAAAEE